MKRMAAVAVLAACLGTAGPVFAQSSDAKPEEDKVVAIVGGEELRMSQVVMLHNQLPQQYRQIPLPMLFPQLVNQLVDRKLLADAAAKNGIEENEEYRQRMAFLREALLQETYIANLIETQITEERLKADYEKMIAEMPPVEEVRARHILVKEEEDAKAIIKEIEAGADFAETAKAKSTGPSGPNGGDLNFFKREQMVKPFADAAFAMKPGDVSKQPVKTQFGWHIIKVEERREGTPPSFAESVDELRTKGARQIVTAMLEKLRGSTEVQTFDIEGKPTGAGADETAKDKQDDKKTE